MELIETSQNRPIKILMVDDSPSDRLIFRRFLGQNAIQAYTFTEAETAKEALELIEKEIPDCILLDYDLPDSNGFELLEKVNHLHGRNSMPIVMLSGSGNTNIVVKTMRSGAQDFLVKDRATPGDLVRAVDNAIDKIRLFHEKQRADENLSRSEEKYRTLFNSIDEGFCVIEVIFDNEKPVDYVFLEANAMFETLTGIKDAIGKRMSEIAPLHDDVWFEIYGQVAVTGKNIRFEKEVPELGIWYEVYAFRVIDSPPNQVCVLFTDVTGRRDAQMEREKLLRDEQAARAEAEKANRLKDEFLATLSHELRTPLSSILGWAKVLQTKNLGFEETKKALATIERNAIAQSQLIEDILDISRIISGKLKLDVRAVDLEKVINAAIETIQLSADAKNIRLQTFIDPKASFISGDFDRLQQVVWNLLSNAVKFTPKNGRIQVKLEPINSHVGLIVSDNGKGIEEDFLPFVFDRFRQFDGSMTRRHSGLGLGLSIVRQIVELHGGTVEVASDGHNQGATFTVCLPLMPINQDSQDELPSDCPATSTENISINGN